MNKQRTTEEMSMGTRGYRSHTTDTMRGKNNQRYPERNRQPGENVNTAYEEGRAAFKNNLAVHFNPHQPPGCEEYLEWERGYASAFHEHKEELENSRTQEKRALDKRTQKYSRLSS